MSTQLHYRRKDKVYSSNETGYRGIYFDKKDRKYRVRLRIANKRYYFGCYSVLEDAVKALQHYEPLIRAQVYGQVDKVTCSACGGKGWVLEPQESDYNPKTLPHPTTDGVVKSPDVNKSNQGYEHGKRD